MRYTALMLLASLMANISTAQFIKEKSINAQIGIAFSSAFDSSTEFRMTVYSCRASSF
ncbi:MAG: hypothetical protein ACFCUL_03360 [Flavobacteriaceae bacterium]